MSYIRILVSLSFFFCFCLIIGKTLLVTSAKLCCLYVSFFFINENDLELEYLQIMFYFSSLYKSF